VYMCLNRTPSLVARHAEFVPTNLDVDTLVYHVPGPDLDTDLPRCAVKVAAKQARAEAHGEGDGGDFSTGRVWVSEAIILSRLISVIVALKESIV